MIQKIIHRLLLRRHFWRYASFSEVAEIYASRTMRIFALRMVAVFTSIYLLQQGFPVYFIAFFFAAFYGYKALFSWPSAYIVAAFGPKHATLFSNILAAGSMAILPLVPEYGIWAVAAWGLLQASSTCLYDLAYMVDFSKVKNSEHAGKEIAFMTILERVATGISPLVGGLLAFLAGPQIVMIVAAILFLLAALPLFRTAEPVRIHQKLEFRGFPWRTTWRSLVAETAVGFDIFTTGTAWTLFLAIVIFAGDGNEIYAKVGVLASVSILAVLFASYAFGQLIDRRRGRELLRTGVILNSFTHMARFFVSTPVSVVLTNVINDITTTAYSMAFTRGMFDTADSTGRRIVYLLFIETTVNLGFMLAAIVLGSLLLVLPADLSLRTFFIIAAGYVLVINTPRFALYRK